MKCENCGKELECIEINDFQRDGSDAWCEYPVFEHENGAYLDATQNWTGWEMSDEEMVESVRCPHCKKFPFRDHEIQTYQILRIVMFKEGEETINSIPYDKVD